MSYSTGALVQTVGCEFLQHTVWGWVIWSWHVRHVRCEGRSNRQTNVQCFKNIMHSITFTQLLITKSKNNSSSHLIRLSWDISELKFSYLKFKLQMRYYCCCMLEDICVLLLLWLLLRSTWILGFPGGSDGKESACNARDLGLIPGSGRSLGEEHGYPLQYSCLENSMVRGDWRATVHEVTESDMIDQLTLSLLIWISQSLGI